MDDAIQRAAGRIDPVPATDQKYQEPGGRYVDFLVPGLIGMGVMGGGLWGLGFVIVDMRIRKLLKRFLATPMRKTDFLLSLMISRFAFLIPEVAILLLFAYLAFDVPIVGSLWEVILVILIGATAFSGLGLLIASRAKTIEAVSGLMNLVMVPMWTMSGIFFSSERLPDVMQPFVKMLPMTLMLDALRPIMLEGASITQHGFEVGMLILWTVVTFVVALTNLPMDVRRAERLSPEHRKLVAILHQAAFRQSAGTKFQHHERVVGAVFVLKAERARLLESKSRIVFGMPEHDDERRP